MTRTTRTTGPLHFEDLEPKRFEDLIRQLAYEFRVWRTLEATGRSGSDDGFDARGLEIVAGTTEGETDDDQEEAVETVDSDRLWLIQCKREKSIGPTKLAAYLDEIRLQAGEVLHGMVFAAACDFSKKAHDKFVEKCRALGLRECHLWGKAAIEDLLFQPKNDHLLFAYFGFSLLIRQRTLQATLRRDIATKKRVKNVIERSSNRVVVVRNAAGDIYPKIPPPQERFAEEHWRLCPFKEIHHLGLMVEFGAYLAYLDGESWDVADAIGLRRSHLYLGRWERGAENREAYDSASELWNSFEKSQRAWLYAYAIIPFDQILAVDEIGDEYFDGPHLYCRYEKGVPFTHSYASVEPADQFSQRVIWVEGHDDHRRIEKFPSQFRLRK